MEEKIVLELAKIALQSYFQYLRIINLTEEQKEKFYQETKKEFDQNNPLNLKDL